MKIRKTQLGSNKGLSVIAAVTTLLLLIIMAMVAVSLISVRVNISADALNSKRALYIAEAGLSVAKYTLRNNWSKEVDPATTSFPKGGNLAGGTFIATVSTADVDPTKEAVVTVTGKMDKSKRAIRSEISRYHLAMTSPVYSEGDVEISGNASVNPIEDVKEYADMPIPGLNVGAAITAAQANTDNGFASGNYFQPGDFPSPDPDGPPTSLNGVIFIVSPDVLIHIDGGDEPGISTNDGNPAFLIVLGNLKITGVVNFNGLIYTTGTTEIDTTFLGKLTLNGAIITSGNVDVGGNSSVIYNATNVINDTTTSLLTGEDSPQEISWKEIRPP